MPVNSKNNTERGLPFVSTSALGLLGVLVLLVVGVLALTLWSPEVPVQPVAVTSLSVPEEVPAGTIVSIDAVSTSQSGTAQLIVANAFGRLVFALPIEAGSGRLDLPASVTQQAGVITVISGEQQATLTVTPADVAEVVAPLVGPRTIVADGRDVSLAVVFPVDRFGNQVSDGTNVDIEWQQPTRSGEPDNETNVAIETVDGMASVLLPSGQIAGPTMIRSTATTSSGEAINGAAIRIDEVPGQVAAIALTASETHGVSDGRSLIEVETHALFDAFENQLADGTLGQFIFDGPAGQGVIPGTVQNGVVRIEIVAPDVPGTLVGHLELQGEKSNEVEIEFASAIASFDARLEQIGADVRLRVDSALDPDGAFIADGTEVRWGDQSTQIRQGAADIWLPAVLVPDDIPSVEILGLEQLPAGADS